MPIDASRPELRTVGNYDLVEKIAEGGMGTVYKGRHRETGEIVAVKVVAQHMTSNQVLLKRFEQEYVAAKQLDHPNIVKAIDYGDTGSTPYLVMEYVDGETLGQRVEREGKIPEREAIRLIAQVAQGLHRAHKEGLIHRDVKPDNILVSKDGKAKLTDLGLVKDFETDLNLTRTGRGLGTPHFMAPEQFKNAKNVDARCDVYSLGATLYMMVTGQLPFRSSAPLDAYMKKVANELPSPKQLAPELSDRIDKAIRRAMHSDLDVRPANCREFIEDLTGRSTRPVDSRLNAQAPQQDIWYLRYDDEDGVPHTVKGTTGGICRSLREQLLGDASNVRASRSKEGPFEPLRNFPEFRIHVIDIEAPGSSPSIKTNPTSKPSVTPPKQPSSQDQSTVEAPPVNRIKPRGPRIDLETTPPKPTGWPVWLQALLWIGVAALSGSIFYAFILWRR